MKASRQRCYKSGVARLLLLEADRRLTGAPKCPRPARRSRMAIDIDSRAWYCHCEYMSQSVKDERLQIRVNPHEKRLLERAAEAAHLSVSAFVVAAAAERAESVLAERQVVALSPAAAEAFSAALNRPGEVNARLAVALKRKRGFRFVD